MMVDITENQIKEIVERMKNRAFPFEDQMINDYYDKYLENTRKE